MQLTALDWALIAAYFVGNLLIGLYCARRAKGSVSIVVMWNLESIAHAWKILLATGAGTGAVLLLRWFWWRINAWSEVSAMLAAALSSILLQTVLGLDSDDPDQFARLMLASVGVATVVWLAVTYLTPPEPPVGPWWRVACASRRKS